MTPRSRSATILATMLQRGGASSAEEGGVGSDEGESARLPSAPACPPPGNNRLHALSDSAPWHGDPKPELTPRTALSEAVMRIRKVNLTHADAADAADADIAPSAGASAGASTPRGVRLDTNDADRCRSPTRAYRV